MERRESKRFCFGRLTQETGLYQRKKRSGYTSLSTPPRPEYVDPGRMVRRSQDVVEVLSGEEGYRTDRDPGRRVGRRLCSQERRHQSWSIRDTPLFERIRTPLLSLPP